MFVDIHQKETSDVALQDRFLSGSVRDAQYGMIDLGAGSDGHKRSFVQWWRGTNGQRSRGRLWVAAHFEHHNVFQIDYGRVRRKLCNVSINMRVTRVMYCYEVNVHAQKELCRGCAGAVQGLWQVVCVRVLVRVKNICACLSQRKYEYSPKNVGDWQIRGCAYVFMYYYHIAVAYWAIGSHMWVYQYKTILKSNTTAFTYQQWDRKSTPWSYWRVCCGDRRACVTPHRPIWASWWQRSRTLSWETACANPNTV